MNYVLKDWFGIKRPDRDLTFLCRRFATTDTHSLFRADRFLADNGFLPQTAIHFVNHHEAHALPALFYTDWDDALLYTSDGVGDNVSFSIRVLRDGRLDCFYGDDRWLVPAICEHGLARAYGYATIACGYRELRHEGKLVGLAARGEPKLAEELAACFHLGELGVVKSPFKHPQGAEARLTRFLA
jgi:carbamoyltransferase